MPICRKCSEEKPVDLFEKSNRVECGHTNFCKSCVNARKREDYKKPHIKQTKTDYHAKNAEKNIEYQKEYREKNKDTLLEKRRAPEKIAHKKALDHSYTRANPDKICAKAAKRRASKLKATPPWAELEEIKKVYAKSKQMEEETGEKYHVDHIVPLNSHFVSGLHCLANLQILPGSENCQKSNVYWPDMPDKLDYKQLCKDHSNALKHTIIEIEVEVAQVAPSEFFEKYKL